MSRKIFLSLALLGAFSGFAATSGFLLGVDYSEWGPANATRIATDNSGALYILSAIPSPGTGLPTHPIPSWVTKLSADGKTILWQNHFGFAANQMVVDPNGGVYVIPVTLLGDTSISVAKLGTNGTGVAWTLPVGLIPPFGWQPILAADSSGRAYVTRLADVSNVESEVIRLNAAGTAIDYTAHLAGDIQSLAINTSGEAFAAGTGFGLSSFLAQIKSDGSAGFYSTNQVSGVPAVAVDANGNAVVDLDLGNGSAVVQRFDSSGIVTSSRTISASATGFGFALDNAGNIYLAESVRSVQPVRNTLATCGPDMLAVYAPDCSLLQRTYIPGGQGFGGFNAMVATGPNSTVFVLDAAAPSFTPTDTGLFPAGQENEPMLLRLSPNPDAQTLPLACMGNAATYDNIAPIAPGEIVTLFGNGLGPQQGIQTQATLQTPFPTQEAGVEVTFDGKPAPLLWVQDEQINAVAPWSLTPDQNTEVCVSRNNVKTNCLTRPVGQTSMGVFLAKLNQDGTVNSAKNPAAPGSVVVVFATGMGPIAPAQADGALVGPPFPANVLPVFADAIYYPPYQPSQVIPLVVDYAGPAPFLLAGVSQINFHVPNVAAPTIFFRLGSSGSLEAATYVYLSPP